MWWGLVKFNGGCATCLAREQLSPQSIHSRDVYFPTYFPTLFESTFCNLVKLLLPAKQQEFRHPACLMSPWKRNRELYSHQFLFRCREFIQRITKLPTRLFIFCIFPNLGSVVQGETPCLVFGVGPWPLSPTAGTLASRTPSSVTELGPKSPGSPVVFSDQQLGFLSDITVASSISC